MLISILPQVEAAKFLGNPNAPVGGTFQYNLGQQPTTLNPLSSSDYYASVVQSYVLESLADRNLETFEWEPVLAESWEVSKDGLTFTFNLKKDIKWHDGKPFTAEDVKFTFDAIMDKENRWKTAHSKPYFENIKEVKIINPFKVQFIVGQKYFRNFEVVAGLSPVPAHLYKDLSKKNIRVLNKTLIGTGPYELSELKKGKHLILKKNENWWGLKDNDQKGKYNFGKILMRFIKDGTIAITRTERGEIDFLSLSDEEYVKKTTGKKWGKEVFKVETQNQAPSGYSFIGWNLTNPLFTSKKTRLALYHLLNRKLMNEKFQFGLSEPATGPVYKSSDYANSEVKAVEYDPKLALKLLKEDGWIVDKEDSKLYKMIDGKKTKLSFTILEPNEEFVKYLTIFQEDAKKAGVDVNIKYVDWTTFIKLLDERKFEAVRLGWSGGSVDWDPKQVWHSDSINGGSNFIGYSNKVVDKLIDDSRMEMDKDKRVALLKKAFKIIADDVPYCFFFNSKYIHYAYTKRMQREKDTYKYGVGLNYWWITK